MEKQLTYDQHPPDRDYGSTVLIVDDEEAGRNTLRLACEATNEGERLRVFVSSNISDAIEILSTNPVQVILLDKNIKNEKTGEYENGIKAIPTLLRIQPYAQILMVTGSKDTEDIDEAMGKGAFGYVTKETEHNILIAQINKAIGVANLMLEKVRLDRAAQDTPAIDLAGRSPGLKKLLSRIQAVATTNHPVLLLGESGTGKTASARLINEMRKQFLKQKNRPFVEVNIGALSPNLVDRELFGNEDGAYTGAGKTKPGFFELANNGTIFLDEIGEASLDVQVKLLKIIEEGKFFRVGGGKEIHSSFKLICATNKNLEEMITQGRFREDLYMRISTFVIKVPSLEERREDIPAIVESLLPRCCREVGVFVKFEKLPKPFIQHLTNSPFRGNIRGIYQQLCRVLGESTKDGEGRPDFSNWYDIVDKPNVIKLSNGQIKKHAITLHDLTNLPFDVVGPDFPGIGALMGIIKDKIFLDAMSKMKKNREIAKVLKLAESATYTRIQKIRETYGIGKKASGHSAPSHTEERAGVQ